MKTLIQFNLPSWITYLFLVCIPLPAILLTLLARKGASFELKSKVFYTVIGFFTCYYVYIGFASYMGWFSKISLPPKVLLLTTFPFATFLFVVLLRLKSTQSIISKLSVQDLIRVHIFRLIGGFFIILALYNTLPKPFAFIAGFGDVITAITSVVIVKKLNSKASNARTYARFWNWFGTIDIIFTAISANVLTKLSIDNGTMGVDALAMFPFCYIPALAPPLILFLHMLIFKKLKNTT
jgi:hypothetical protein